MRLYEIKAALEKLGVTFKKTEKKSVLEAVLRETLANHDHTAGHGRRGRSTPAPASASKTRLGLRGHSSPPVTNHSLRSAGYGLRSRDDSHTRSAHATHATVSHLAEVSAGHIKAHAATAPPKAEPYEENGFLFYSTKGGMRSPSVSSRRSRARSERSTRSSRNAEGSESEEEDGYDGQDTVVKVRKVRASETPKPESKKSRATPKPTPKSEQSKGRGRPSAKKAIPALVTQEEVSNESDIQSASEKEEHAEDEQEMSQEELNDSHADFFDANDGGSQDGQDDMVFEGPATREEAGADAVADMDIVDEEYSDESGSEDAGADAEEGSVEEESGEEEGYDVREDGSEEDADEDGTIPSEIDEEFGQEIDIEGGSSADEGDELEEEGDHTAGSDEGSYGEEEGSQEEENSEDDQEDDDHDEDVVVMEIGSSDEGSGEEEGSEEEGSDDSDEVDSEAEDEDEDEDEEWPFTEPRPSEIVELLESSSDEEEEYKAPAFAFTTPAATATTAPAATKPFEFKLPATAVVAPVSGKFEFKLPAGAVTIAPPAPVVFKYPATLSDPSKSKITFDTLPGLTPFAPAVPAATPAVAAAPAAAVKAPFVFGQSNNNAPNTFTFTAPAPVVSVAAPVAAPVSAPAEPAAEVSPAVAAFTKLSQNVMAVFANNLTSTKKEKLSVEEYALLKSLLESSRPPEVEATPAKPTMRPVEAPVVKSPTPAAVTVPAVSTTAEKVKSPLPALDTTLPTAEKSQDGKENLATKSISFDAKDAHIPRTSYDGGAWNSRESFLPSPPASPAVHFADTAAPSERLSGQLFADVQAGRLAHRLPTPYHTKRNAFSAGWTGGSEPGSVSFDEDALASLPPSKRQSLEGGYLSIQYRQQTPGAAYVNQGRLSVGSGIISDTPDLSWSAGSNLRTGSARNSVSGYSGMAPPSFNLNQAGGFAMGRASYTPGFRNNAVRFTPSAAPVSSAQGVAEGPQSETRLSRLPVSTSTRASLGGAANGNLSSTLSYVQRRKLQLKAENGQSAAVAKKILETLNGLSTPMEEQRAKPMAISWDNDVKSPAESRHAPATPHPVKSAMHVSFKDNASPLASTPAAASAKVTIPEKQASAPPSTAKMDSPFVHSSIRQKPEPTPTFKVTPAVPVVAPASDEEFTFEEPMEVSGVEDQVKETRDPATGTLKRSLLNAAATDDYSVKYAFSPPGKAPKVEIPVSVVSKAPVAAATPVAPKAAAVPAEKAAPATAAPPASSGTGIWALSAINDGVKCGVCMSKNSKGATKCASCESPIGGDSKPAAAPASAPTSAPIKATAAPPASSGTGIWALSAINDGIKCGVCMSKNSKGATKCASCESPLDSAAATAEKPAPAAASSGFGAPATTTVPGTISKSGFTFGAPVATKPFNSEPAPASAPAAGAISGSGFTFGAPVAAPATSTPATSTTSAGDSTATKSGFSFPSFGTAPASSGADSTKDATAGFAPAVTKPAAAATSGFGFPPAPAAVEATKEAPKAGFTFGAAPAPAPATIGFGTSMPSFGAPATTAGTSLPSFGTSNSFSSGKRGVDGDAQDSKDTSDEQPSRKRKDDGAGAASFATSTPSFGAFPTLPAGFGGVSTDKPKEVPAAAGGITFPPASSNPFGAITSKPVEEKKIEFGGASDKPAGFTFGATPAPAAADKPTPSGFTFGAPAAAAPSAANKVPAPFTFGGTPAPAAADSQPFKFGGLPDASSKPAATPLPALPAFGSTVPPFGTATTPAASAAPALGAFGLPAVPIPATSSTDPKPFTFGASTATKASTDAPFLFGAAGSASTAGKPPLASSNPLSSPTLGFPGVAAVDSRLGASGAGALTPLPTFGATSASSVGTDSPGSTMDTGSFSNHSAPSTTAASNAFGGNAVSGNPFSSSFGAPAAVPSADVKQPFSFGNNAPAAAPSTTSFAFGASANASNNAAAAPAFGGFAPAANPFGSVTASTGPFGAPAATTGGPFGGSSGAGGPFGGAPALGGLGSSASNSNLFGAAPGGASQQPGGLGGAFGSNNNLAAAGGGFGAGAFGSSGNLPSLGGNMGMGGFGAGSNNNSMGGGLGGFGQQSSQNSLSQAGAGGAGGFSLGAADKKASTDGRRKVKVPPRK